MNAHVFYANKEAVNDLLVMLLIFGLGPMTGLKSQFINRLLKRKGSSQTIRRIGYLRPNLWAVET